MDNNGMSLNEIYGVFENMPGYCPVCGEQLHYGVTTRSGSNYVTIFVFCDSGVVASGYIRHDCVEKSDLEHLLFKLGNEHP